MIRRLVISVTLLVVGLLVPTSASAQGETVEYYGVDAIGSVRVVFNATGAMVGRKDYAPFGEELGASAGIPNERFAELSRDGESGLDYAQARMYQFRTGRFNTVDPVYAGLFQPQAWNRYSYALNSPLALIDPGGLNADACTWTEVWVEADEDGEGYLDTQLTCPEKKGGGGGGGGGGGSSLWGDAWWILNNWLDRLTLATSTGSTVPGEDEIVPTERYTPSGTAVVVDNVSVVAAIVTPIAAKTAIAAGVSNVAVKSASNIAQNAVRGKAFERQALNALGAVKNTRTVEVPGLGRSIPDVMGNGILEIKDVVNLSFTRQLQIQAAAANGPFSLVVSPRTQTISGPLRTAVSASGGSIRVFDPATNTFRTW